jgi:hypothetical protein
MVRMHILLAISAAVLLQAQGAAIKGTLSSKGGTLTPIDTVGVWDAAKGEIWIAMVPFKIKPAHLLEIQKDSTMLVVLGEKSPDPKKWADWCPGAQIRIKINAKDLGKGAAGVESYALWAYGLQEKNFTDNASYDGDRAREHVKKLAVKVDAKGGSFELEFSGKSGFDDGLTWSISAKGPVLPSKADK